MTRLSKYLIAIILVIVIVVDRGSVICKGISEGNSLGMSLTSHGPYSLFLYEVLRGFETFLDSFNKTFTFLTAALVALFTWTLFRTARDQLVTTRDALAVSEQSVRITEQTMISAQRPWISVEVGLSGPLTITDKEVRVELGFKLKNVGKSPARNVQIEPKLVPFMNEKPEDHAISRQKKMCDEARQNPLKENSVLGHTIFPGEGYTQPMTVSISIEELKNSYPFDEEIDWFSLELIGYVSYRTAFNDGLHLTQFNGSIAKPNPTRPGMYVGISFDDKILSPGQYGIWLNPLIGGQAD